jgi:hypothetical protein
MHAKFLSETFNRKDHLGDLGMDKGIIIRMGLRGIWCVVVH